MWLLILNNEKPPEGPVEMTFHLFSEFLMATICIVSGILLLKNNSMGKPINFIGLGMIIYSVLNAAGYYGERQNFPMVVMFIILCILSMIAIFVQLDKRTENGE